MTVDEKTTEKNGLLAEHSVSSDIDQVVEETDSGGIDPVETSEHAL